MNRVVVLKSDYQINSRVSFSSLDSVELENIEERYINLINIFKNTYKVEREEIEYEYTDDNDELGTGSGRVIKTIYEINDDSVFIFYNDKIVGLTMGYIKDIIWYDENNISKKWFGYKLIKK